MTAKNATSGKLVEELYTLFYYYPPKQMARNLRKMFLDYAEGELSVGTPDYFNDLIPNLNWLFNFLDVAEEEFVISDNEEPTEFDNYLLFDNNAIKTTINFIVALIRPEKIYSIRYDVEIEAINNTNYD
ncbi:MAG: hypothetical protein EOP48_00915 [Sphingobacteriales bacterium]|nr:MAG: hypothetical protein EOP48_00915 [Sphingobacteriales bacterium]